MKNKSIKIQIQISNSISFLSKFKFRNLFNFGFLAENLFLCCFRPSLTFFSRPTAHLLLPFFLSFFPCFGQMLAPRCPFIYATSLHHLNALHECLLTAGIHSPCRVPLPSVVIKPESKPPLDSHRAVLPQLPHSSIKEEHQHRVPSHHSPSNSHCLWPPLYKPSSPPSIVTPLRPDLCNSLIFK